MKKITLAESAGFCFGVDRAIKMVYDLLEKDKEVCTLGPIIHNSQVVSELESKGVQTETEFSRIKDGVTLVIRSHGVPPEVIRKAEERQLEYVDATCPFVKKIHRLVEKASNEGKIVFILGDKNHPEVIGIKGYVSGEVYVIKDENELLEIAENNQQIANKDICMVAQTTFDSNICIKCLEIAKKVYTKIIFFDTICSATSERQQEAKNLAVKSDLMIIIGDKNSSNTCKLYSICKAVCPETYLVQNREELPKEAILIADNIGVTAGASAPARIIKEVLDKMADEIKNASSETNEGNLDFAEMLEENLKSFNTDGRVQGVVESITPNEVYVDVGRKQAGVVKLNELTDDPNATTEELVKIGDVLDLIIMRTNDQEGVITLSKKRVDALKGWDTIVQAQENDTILSGFVTEVVKGGVIVVSTGVKVFIPASQATASRNEPLEGLLKKEVNFKIIDINQNRRRAVGSIRVVLKEEKEKLQAAFWADCEVGKVYTGTVKSLTSYGAFVDIGGVDGMIHISELSWERIKHPSDVVKVGDVVEVFVKDIDSEKGNVSLGYKKTEDNPWEILKRDYPVGTITEAEVVGLTTFGAFAKVLPGIDGLIHISQIANRRIEKPQDELSVGQKVMVKVTAIDFDKKRVSLSIRELLEPDKEEMPSSDEDEIVATSETPANDAAPAQEQPAEEVAAAEAAEPATEEAAE